MAGPVAITTIDVTQDHRVVLSDTLDLGANRDPQGHELSANSLYFMRDGKPWYPVMGEMHFSRYPRQYWEEALLKMKACGIDVVATYVFWIHHEELEGQFDWNGSRDLRAFAQLCAKHGLALFLRIGPWCHGEVRNGGFPDWIYSKGKVRSTDPKFLHYVGLLYDQIGRQIHGLTFKEGGPIIGVQLENEFSFKTAAGLRYMLALKRLARAAGIDVPFYSATGWPGADTRQKELLPVYGGYPAAPWTQNTRELPPSGVFLFSHLRNDPIIGSDILGPRKINPATYKGTRYPYATAEMGAGNQITYHRRPVIAAKDVVVPAYVRVGSGANLLGYYMFHGGSNPIGKNSTMQESRSTGYPNDLPLISYDFYAPIGEWGQLRPSYRQFKELNTFLNDFGSMLAPMISFLPAQRPKGVGDVDTLRCAARAKDDSGFLFLSNYVRHLSLHDIRDAQVKLELHSGVLTVPEKPFTLKAGAVMIWPFNLQMNGARLIYATAQPFCILPEGQPLYVFFVPEGIPAAEYVFDATTVTSIRIDEKAATVAQDGNRIRLSIARPGTACVAEVHTADNQTVRVLTLTTEQALNCWKTNLGGRERLILSDRDVIPDVNSIRIESTGQPRFSFSLYPDAALRFPPDLAIDRQADGIFTHYAVNVPPRQVKVETVEQHDRASKEVLSSAEQRMSAFRETHPLPLKGAVAIWNRQRADVCYLRKTFEIPRNASVESAWLAFLADERLDLWINGRKVDSGGRWNRLTAWDVTSFVQPGANVLACRIANANGPGGLMARLFVRHGKTETNVATDLTWKVSITDQKDWQTLAFDDSQWEAPLRVSLDENTTWHTTTQPGPQYGATYAPIAGARTWRIELPPDALKGLNDLFLKIDYAGDTAALYLNKRLVADDFYAGLPMTVGLKRFRKELGTGPLLLQIVPLSDHRDIYFEPGVRAKVRGKSVAVLHAVTAVPQYALTIAVPPK